MSWPDRYMSHPRGKLLDKQQVWVDTERIFGIGSLVRSRHLLSSLGDCRKVIRIALKHT